MGSIARSAWVFVTRAWWLLLAIVPAVGDAGGLMATFGLIPEQLTWLTPTLLRWLFFVVALVVAFVWFHRERVRFEGDWGGGEMELPDAIRHLSERSRWALSQPHESVDWPILVRAELLKRLSGDRCKTRGHLVPEGFGPEDGQKAIDPDFWRDPKMEAIWDILTKPDDRNWASNSRRRERFDGVMLPKDAVFSVWPSASPMARLWRRVRYKGQSTARMARAARLRELRIAKLNGRNLATDRDSPFRQLFWDR